MKGKVLLIALAAAALLISGSVLLKTWAQDVTTSPKEDTSGLPADLVALIQQNYAGDGYADTRANLYNKYRPEVQKFEQFWVKFQEYAKKTLDEVAKAEALEKSGNLDGARKILQDFMSALPRDERGKFPFVKQRGFITMYDAEFPVIEALLRIAKKQQDWVAIFQDVPNYLAPRRHVSGNKDDELMMFLCSAPDEQIGRYTGSSGTVRNDVQKRVHALWEKSARIRGEMPNKPEGIVLARSLAADCLSYGVIYGVITYEQGKPGDWIMMGVPANAFSGTTIKHKETQRWGVPIESHKTDRIQSYDLAGNPIYEIETTYQFKSREITLDGTMKTPAPSWVGSPAWAYDITIIGKIVSPGPNWVLSDVSVIDDRAFSPLDVFN